MCYSTDHLLDREVFATQGEDDLVLGIAGYFVFNCLVRFPEDSHKMLTGSW